MSEDPSSRDRTGPAALTFSWSRPRRLLCYYLIGVGAFAVLGSPMAFAGLLDSEDAPNPVTAGLQLLFGGLVWLGLMIWLSRAEVRADSAGIRSQAVIVRSIPAVNIVDIRVRGVPHGMYAPYPLAPYVYRRTGRAVKLTPMERLDIGDNRSVLEEQCRQLRAAVGLVDDTGTRRPPQGWYPAPGEPGTLRWWDGRNWTANTQPVPAHS